VVFFWFLFYFSDWARVWDTEIILENLRSIIQQCSVYVQTHIFIFAYQIKKATHATARIAWHWYHLTRFPWSLHTSNFKGSRFDASHNLYYTNEKVFVFNINPYHINLKFNYLHRNTTHACLIYHCVREHWIMKTSCRVCIQQKKM